MEIPPEEEQRQQAEKEAETVREQETVQTDLSVSEHPENNPI